MRVPLEETMPNNCSAAAKPSRATVEIAKRILCKLSCIAVLIASAITLSIINEVESTVSERGIVYEDASSYRTASVWLICTSSVGIVYHVLMIYFCYFYLNSVFKKHYNLYLFINAVLCVVFALCLFAGGVVNALYSADSHQLSPDICTTTFGKLNDEDKEVCTNILKVKICEGVSAGLSFLSTLAFGSLLIFTIGSCPQRGKVHISQDQIVPSPPQGTSSHPSNPPPYSSTSPPPYETVMALS